jgi:DNA-binding NtrC family response regulator
MAKVLLVDDDDGVRGFVQRALMVDGHDVTTASDGAEALDTIVAQDGGFDLLVSDIRMPMMDGIALSLEVARTFPGLPILLMTGYADQRERASHLEALIRDVILKPFSLADSRSKVKDVLQPDVAA